MKFEIKNRFSNQIIFTLETSSIKLCLETANLSRANLSGANLSGADLSRADLSGAKLYGANLVGKHPILQIGPIGSRSAYLQAYITKKGVHIKAGCFEGTLAEFSNQVISTHGDNHYGQEYTTAIAMITAYAKIQMNGDK